MNGLEISEVQFSELEKLAERLDAEYYKPQYLREDKQRYKYQNIVLGDIAFVTDGQHGYHEVDENSPIFHLTAKHAKNWFAHTIDADRIAKWVDEKNIRSSLRIDDLILSTRGTVGHCAIVKQEVLPANIDQDIARIALNEDSSIWPQYLLVYLNCRFGNDWLIRNASGMVQQGLSLWKVRQLPVPLLSKHFQEKIKKVVEESYKLYTQSHSYYQQAEQHLLSELGLADWQSTHQTTFVRNFSDFLQTDRLDAEYFRPAMIEIIDLVKQKEYVLLREHAKIISGYPWKSQYFLEAAEQGEPFVRIRDCKPGAIDIEELTRLEATYASGQNTKKANKGDLVIGMDGVDYFHASLIIQPCFVNQRVCQVSLKSDAPITPEYLLLIINNKIGQTQLLREMTIAHTVGHITNENIRNLYIPLLPGKTIQQISNFVKQFIRCKFDSKQLLEIAKRGVEMAIEQDEKAAEAWIQEQMEQPVGRLKALLGTVAWGGDAIEDTERLYEL